MNIITKEQIEWFKTLYNKYMFGDLAQEYYDYCEMKDMDYGSLGSLIGFENIVSRLDNPEENFPKMPLDAKDNKDTLDQYQMIFYLYQEYRDFCREKGIDEKSFNSYKLFCKSGGEDFI